MQTLVLYIKLYTLLLHIAFKLFFDEQISVLEYLENSVNKAGNGIHAFLEFAE